MNLKQLSKKLDCKEVEVHAAILSLFLKAVQVQENCLEYHFRESEVEAFITRRYPEKYKRLRIIKD